MARQEDICRVYTVKGDNMGKKKNDLEKKLSGTMSEFKAFILKGNIIDMAVGVIIGGGFRKNVNRFFYTSEGGGGSKGGGVGWGCGGYEREE